MLLSKCCKSSVHVEGNVTCYYVCDNCGRSSEPRWYDYVNIDEQQTTANRDAEKT